MVLVIETIYIHNSLHLLSLGIQISIAYVLWLFEQTPYGRGFLKCFRKAKVRADFASFVKESTLFFLSQYRHRDNERGAFIRLFLYLPSIFYAFSSSCSFLGNSFLENHLIDVTIWDFSRDNQEYVYVHVINVCLPNFHYPAVTCPIFDITCRLIAL